MSNGSNTVTGAVQIPRPMVPGVLTNNLLQTVSIYRSLRSIIDTVNAGQGVITFGTVATYAPDGSPLTFTQGGLDGNMIRVAANGNPQSLNIPDQWVSGGGETTIAHHLTQTNQQTGAVGGRVPIGYMVIRKSRDCDIFDGTSAWTATNIYLRTTHSDADCTLLIF